MSSSVIPAPCGWALPWVLSFGVNRLIHPSKLTGIECPYFQISLRNNPESVDVLNPDLIPIEYFTIPEPPPPILDKVALKKAIQSGKEVEGARLIRNQSIQIK